MLQQLAAENCDKCILVGNKHVAILLFDAEAEHGKLRPALLFSPAIILAVSSARCCSVLLKIHTAAVCPPVVVKMTNRAFFISL